MNIYKTFTFIIDYIGLNSIFFLLNENYIKDIIKVNLNFYFNIKFVFFNVILSLTSKYICRDISNIFIFLFKTFILISDYDPDCKSYFNKEKIL